jgi:hypothetical protein
MIFLAVTPGFFAETLREKISENSQATELAKNLSKGSFYLYNLIILQYLLAIILSEKPSSNSLL